jgi:preprotein translocase subunit YajC
MWHSALLLTAPSGGSGSSTTSLLFLAVFIMILYFFMIRPQAKKAKEQRGFIDSIQKGQRVVTSGGIHGRVVQTDDRTLLLEIDKNVKIRIERSMVSVDFSKNLGEDSSSGS